MGRTNQGGSILSFIIVGVVVAALLVGGVYFVRNYQAMTAEIAAGPVMPGNDSADAPKPVDEGSKPAPSTDKEDTPTTSKPSADTTTPPASTTEKPDNTAGPSSPSATETTPTTDESASKDRNVAALPQTGPVDTIAAMLSVGLFVVASLAYIRSCRTLGTL
ncbi:MAG: hypothetical protein ABIR91_03865 [Candidatus Saccharimonadales bacterium]